MREMRSKECVEGRDHGLEGGRLAA
jgi:hypothetical protein